MSGAGASEIGYAALATLEVRTPVHILRIRADGLFANWGGSDQRLTSLTASVVGAPPVRWRAAPYVMAGGGGYAVPNQAVSRGWTLGAGLRFPAERSVFFVESRVHAFDIGESGLRRSGLSPSNATYNRWRYTYTPLVFGIQF
jgi:hypothetical protein